MRSVPTDARCDGWPLAVCVEPPRDEMNCPVWRLMEHGGYERAAQLALGLNPDADDVYGNPFRPSLMRAVDELSWSMRLSRESNVCASRPPCP